LKPLNALLSRGLKNFYSYDLSAATDRLPITLQERKSRLLYCTYIPTSVLLLSNL
jgi:hypothetical protein